MQGVRILEGVSSNLSSVVFFFLLFFPVFPILSVRTTILSVSLMLEQRKSLVLEHQESLVLERRSLVRTTEILSVSLVLERRESLVSV